MIGFDGFERLTGTKLHVAVDGTGLPMSTVMSPADIHDSTKFIDVICPMHMPYREHSANVHDSTKFIDVLENISKLVDDDLIRQIISVYADRGYDAAYIRNYLRSHGIDCCIPYKRNSRNVAQNRNQRHHCKTRFVVERFFAWLKCGFHRTAVRYERN